MVDTIQLRFSPASLQALNVVLGLVIFGIALDLVPDDFRRVLRTPRPVVVGLVSQFVLLPALTFVLVSVTQPPPSMALGLFLVAACPGGTFSNFLTHLARGRTALSVTMTAVSTVAAIFMTPALLSFWGNLYPPSAELLRRVSLDPLDVLFTVATILGLPLVAGMVLAYKLPLRAAALRRPMRIFSLIAFGAFVVLALAANFDYFLDLIGIVAGVVWVHNTLALATGYFMARLSGLPEADRRAVAIEVGIQNSGLALILIFSFFEGLGGMAIVAAWWGVWHLVSGLTLAAYWSRRPPLPPLPGAAAN